MDKNHKLNAPHNESLQDVEQLSDHSELSALYFRAHKEWEGKALISDQERQAKSAKEQLASMLAIRRFFVIIGVLVPLPLLLTVSMAALAAKYITIESLRFLLPVVVIALFSWALISYFAIRRVYTIFYNHALRATPFIIILITLVGLSTQASYLLTRSILTNSLLVNTLIVSCCALIASVALSGAVLYLWTSPRLSAKSKIGAITLIAALIVVLIFLAVL